MKKLDDQGLVGNYGEIKENSIKKYDEKTWPKVDNYPFDQWKSV